MLTVSLGLERLTMKRTTRTFVLQSWNIFAKPMHRKLVHRRQWRALLLRLLASRTHCHRTLHQLPLPMQPLESDVILTFSQTIQDLEAQGGRDLSRYPAMNELYDKANGLRPKLALSLDDTDKKESRYLFDISFVRCPSKYFARSFARDARKAFPGSQTL